MYTVSSSWSKQSQPGRCKCHIPGHRDCGDDNDQLMEEYLLLDIEDVTDSVMKVMRICGLRPWEVKRSERVIRNSLTHYEEVRERIDRVPRKRFAKETFLHGLAKEGQMNRMDAQMAYAIVKRAFKALYYGTGQGGKRYICLQAGLEHNQECLWLHAARRTAAIHAVLTGMMHSEEQQFEERIECVYKNLFDVLQTRVVFADNWVCQCQQYNSKPASTGVSSMTLEVEILYQNMQLSKATSGVTSQRDLGQAAGTIPPSSAPSRHNYGLKKTQNKAVSQNESLDFSANSILSQPKCKCPPLRCCREEGEAREAPEITAECSQGPYICRWLPYTEEDDKFDEHCAPFPPMEEVCPPCVNDEISCDSECTCTCQVCTCRPHYDGDDIGEEENLGEKGSKSGVEDYDTDYCWLAPFRGSSKERMEKKKLKVEPEVEPVKVVAEAKEALSKCCCMCRYKREFPHLFTYLAPFKEEQKKEPEPEPPAEEIKNLQANESEDLLSKPPPPGISPAGYRCWVKPQRSATSIEQVERPPPHLVYHDPEIEEAAAPPAKGQSPKKTTKPTATAAAADTVKPDEGKFTKEDILKIINLKAANEYML
ncbi:hypothetical protein KR074_003169 [Drosophila pseudoananassae]|nr:hypothetical protein KR074_003169 [Drosophila pseudoananassae]